MPRSSKSCSIQKWLTVQIPRRKGDRLFAQGAPMLWIRRSYEAGEADAIAAKLRAALA